MSFSWVRGMREGWGGGGLPGGDGAGRSAHSSLDCNWISAAHAGRMFSSRSPCREELAHSSFPTSLIVSRLALLMDYFLHWFLRSPSVIYMSEHVGEQLHASIWGCWWGGWQSTADALQYCTGPALAQIPAETRHGCDSTRSCSIQVFQMNPET